MQILFLCGLYYDDVEQQINKDSKGYRDIAALIWQRKFYQALLELFPGSVQAISAPYIGSYPDRYKKRIFPKFEDDTARRIQYVSFENTWGLRNISRYFWVRLKLREFVLKRDTEKLIFIYAPHVPFLKAAVWAKKKDSNIKISLIVPDLPQYQMVGEHNNYLYRFFKYFDIKAFNTLSKHVDSFILFSKYMIEYLNIGIRPYLVVPGIVNKELYSNNENNKRLPLILFTGNMGTKFGIMNLIEAYLMLKPMKWKLVICGEGDASPLVRENVKKSEGMIEYFGVVSQEVAQKLMKKAMILVSPRMMGSGEYTRYSFPSKLVEYMASGGVVVSYDLPVMDEEMRKCLIIPEEQTIESLAKTLAYAMQLTDEQKENYRKRCFEYLDSNLDAKTIVKKIVEMTTN